LIDRKRPERGSPRTWGISAERVIDGKRQERGSPRTWGASPGRVIDWFLGIGSQGLRRLGLSGDVSTGGVSEDSFGQLQGSCGALKKRLGLND